MTERELLATVARLGAQPRSKADWLDLHETIEAYQQRCLARAIVDSPNRDELVEAIRVAAGVE